MRLPYYVVSYLDGGYSMRYSTRSGAYHMVDALRRGNAAAGTYRRANGVIRVLTLKHPTDQGGLQ